jgi:hypothetical protein
MGHALGSLARRWLELHEEIKVHSRHLKQLTKRAAPELVAAFGIGPDVASEMLVTAGDITDRIRSDAALAKLCGVCPIPASLGRTSGRHRLNRGGNRQAKAALCRAIIVRMRWHPPTIAYVERRTSEALSKREIIRRPGGLQPPAPAELEESRVRRVDALTSIGAAAPCPTAGSPPSRTS